MSRQVCPLRRALVTSSGRKRSAWSMRLAVSFAGGELPSTAASHIAHSTLCLAALEVACRRQRGPMDPGGKVRGGAFGDSGGVPGKLLLAEDLPPLAC